VKLLFAREQFGAGLSWADLAPQLPGWRLASCLPDELAGHLDGVDVVCPLGAPIDAATMAAGGFGLIHQFGVGLDKVDIRAATELGIWVARVPGDIGGNAESVAELAVLHLLALTRRLDAARMSLADRRWPQRPPGRSLSGATVLLVGLGAIGSAVASRLAPFGPRLLGVRARPELAGPAEVEQVGGPDQLASMLGCADAVVCCAMFHEGNEGLFGTAEFAAMKPGAIFVNVARGKLVDEAALLAALESGRLAGAGLDVFRREPADPDLPLLRHPAVLATPHIGWLTEQMFRQTGAVFAANLRRWAAGDVPEWTVNAPAFCRTAGLPRY
jgi:phosphoglycerate dehydrogenase-like enzyme